MTFEDLPFTNSLTITRDDFANRLHVDADETGFAYGMWWPASFNTETSRYEFTRNSSHCNVKGGAFLIGEYGAVINFME
jgi:hypothetical protein